MAKISRLAGSTGHVLTLLIQDSTSTVGAGLTGLVFNSAGLSCYYKRNRGTASVAVTLVNITTLGTYVSGGFKEVDAANMPGVYEFHPPDAAIATGSGSVAFVLRGAANMVQCPLEIELTAVDNQDAVRGGITALPNVATGGGGALPTAAQVITALAATALTFRDQTSVTAPTVMDGWGAAWVKGSGAEIVTAGSPNTYVVKDPLGNPFRTFTINSATAPSQRI